MAQQTALSVTATPGRVQSFVAKTEAEVPTIEGLMSLCLETGTPSITFVTGKPTISFVFEDADGCTD